jgi:hypothetical protein
MRLGAVRIEAVTMRESSSFPDRATDSNSRASDENWELSIDQIPHVSLVLHGCIERI